MIGKAKLAISFLSLAIGLGFFAGKNSSAKPLEETRTPAFVPGGSRVASTIKFQLSEEAQRAFSIKQTPNQQQSTKRDPIPPKLEATKEQAAPVASITSAKARPAKRLNLTIVTPHGDEYSLVESDDSSIRFLVTRSRDLESCTGILCRVGQSALFEGELKGVFRYDPSYQARSAPISIELQDDHRFVTIRTDYITWDRYGYEISRRSCVFEATCF